MYLFKYHSEYLDRTIFIVTHNTREAYLHFQKWFDERYPDWAHKVVKSEIFASRPDCVIEEKDLF